MINNLLINERLFYIDKELILKKLESISLQQNEKNIIVDEKIKDILEILNGTKRVTKNKSVQDAL